MLLYFANTNRDHMLKLNFQVRKNSPVTGQLSYELCSSVNNQEEDRYLQGASFACKNSKRKMN